MHETINGYPVLASYFTPANDECSAGRIVIVDCEKVRDESRRYVVAWQRRGDSHGVCWYREWEEVRYCRTLQDARKEFVKRIRKEPV